MRRFIGLILAITLIVSFIPGFGDFAYAASNKLGAKAKSPDFQQIELSWQDENGPWDIYRYSGKKKVLIGVAEDNNYLDDGLKAGSKYKYYIKGQNGGATVSATVMSQKNAVMSQVMNGDDRWDIRIEAGQNEYGYDTIQGACAYDGYAYMSLYNRKVEQIKIAKVLLDTMEVVQVSDPLDVHAHGDTLSYIPGTNEIVLTCGKGGRKQIAFVDADSLTLSHTKTISVSKKLIGESFQGVAGLSYNQENDVFVMKMRTKNNKVVLFDDLDTAGKYVKISGNRSYLLAQGCYTKDEYMYDVQSFKGSHKYNLITVRTLDGKLRGRIKVPSGTKGQLFELENLFSDGDNWYISFYRSSVKKTGDTDRKNYLYKLEKNW